MSSCCIMSLGSAQSVPEASRNASCLSCLLRVKACLHRLKSSRADACCLNECRLGLRYLWECCLFWLSIVFGGCLLLFTRLAGGLLICQRWWYLHFLMASLLLDLAFLYRIMLLNEEYSKVSMNFVHIYFCWYLFYYISWGVTLLNHIPSSSKSLIQCRLLIVVRRTRQ